MDIGGGSRSIMSPLMNGLLLSAFGLLLRKQAIRPSCEFVFFWKRILRWFSLVDSLLDRGFVLGSLHWKLPRPCQGQFWSSPHQPTSDKLFWPIFNKFRPFLPGCVTSFRTGSLDKAFKTSKLHSLADISSTPPNCFNPIRNSLFECI